MTDWHTIQRKLYLKPSNWLKKYTKTIAKINDYNLFASKNIADISNKRKKIKKSNISAIFFINLIEFFVCNQKEFAGFWIDSQVLWFWCVFERIAQSWWYFQSKSLETWFQTRSSRILIFEYLFITERLKNFAGQFSQDWISGKE